LTRDAPPARVDNQPEASPLCEAVSVHAIPFHPAIDGEVIAAARRAALDAGMRFVVGWWNDGAQRRLMLLPENHRLTGEPAFLPLVVVEPAGRAEPRAA